MEALPTPPGRGQVSVDASLLLYALRYALGRRSYAVADVADAIVLQASAIDAATLRVMARDISEHLHGPARAFALEEPEDITQTWEALLNVVVTCEAMQVAQSRRT